MEINHTVLERFLKYVQIDTQSDPESETFPTTEKQKDLSKVLVEELHAMGIANAEMDEYGYVYASIASNSDKKVPSICFCSHVDTAPDCSGTNVKPILHKNYQGQTLVLPDDETQVLDLEKYPYLKEKIGGDIVTGSGLTLLGSDDKSGVAIIMDMAYQLMQNPAIKHGAIKLLFTPDEEVGQGTDYVNLKKLGADFAYTLDGGRPGELNIENFSANGFIIHITGVSAHPGYAKGKMEHACKIAGEILAKLPKDKAAPEVAGIHDGFVHPTKIEGGLEEAKIHFIIRDFETKKLEEHEQMLQDITKEVLTDYPNSSAEFTSIEQYRNMKEILDQFPHTYEIAQKAYEAVGLKPYLKSIRGGTDGARLSFDGLPCPNIFTGMQAIHSKHEWVAVQDMELAVKAVLNICQIYEERA